MTADVVLTLGLEAGPAEAGARVVRRALDQVGAAAASAVGAVQGLKRTLDGLSADRPAAEMKRLESATRAVGAAHAGLGKSAGEALRDSLDLGRRLSAYVRDQLRDHQAIRDAIRRTRSGLGDARRATDEIGRGARAMGDGLGAGFDKGKASITGFVEHAKRSLQQFSTKLAVEMVFKPVLDRSLGGFVGNIFSYFAGGGVRGNAVFDLNSLVFGGKGKTDGGGASSFNLPSNLLSNPAQWLASTFPSLFATDASIAAINAAGVYGTAAELGALSFAPTLGATLLPIAAIALPFILKSLFSKKPSVGPNANATVGRLASGELGVVDSGADNGGNVQAAIDLAETSIKALTKTLRQIGASLSEIDSIRGLQVGYFKGKYFVDDTRLGGTATYEKNQFENAEAAVADFVRRALNRATLDGISPTMRTVLTNTKARSFEDLGRDIDFARDYERDFKPLDAAVAQVEALTRRFDDLRDTAKELGLDITRVDQAFVRERLKLAEDFDRDVASGILSRALQGFRKLAEDAKTRLDQARTLGADLGAVERQAYYEKRALLLQLAEEERKIFLGLLSIAEKAEFAVVESLAKMGEASQKLEGALAGAIAASRQAAGGYRQLAETLRDTATSIRLSDLGLLSSADKFAEVRSQFDNAKTAAAGGDQDAARRLGGLARSTLEMGRQFYGSGPEYAALYEEVVGTLGATAAIQDGIAFRLDTHTVLLDAQLQVLKEIDKRLAKSQEASGVLDYLDMALTRQGVLSDYDRIIAGGEIDRLKELAAALPAAAKASFDQAIGTIGSSLADGSIGLPEADANDAAVSQLRLVFFEELQRQVGSDSDAVSAFDRLKRAINESAGSSDSLSARLKSLATVFDDLKGIFGGAQSPLADPAALQALVGNLAGLIREVGDVVPGDAGGVIGAIEDLVANLPAAIDDIARLDLGLVSTGLDAIGDALGALGADPAIIDLPGDLQEQETAFRSLGGYLGSAGLAPSIADLVGGLEALADGAGGGALASLRGALAGLEPPTADLVAALGDFDTAIAHLIETIKDGEIVGGRTRVEIDRAALTGAPTTQFDTLAGRVGDYIGRGLGAGHSEAQLKAAPSWAWAVAERDRIIQALTTVGDVESLLDRYYGGQRQIVANATDEGANNLVRRLTALGGGSTTPPAEPLGPLVRAFLAANPSWTNDAGERVYEPSESEARSLVLLSDQSAPWRERYLRWWNAGRVVADLDKFALGGVVAAPTLFGHGGRLGLMGEAGPEAILPLRRGRDGRLGVAANANDRGDSAAMADLLAELRALRAEVADLRRQQAGEHRESIGQGALVAHRLSGRRAAAGGRG